MIYFIIGFIVGAIIMMCAILLVAYQKDKKPQNKVKFFVMLKFDGKPCLYIEDIDGRYYPIANADNMNRFGLNAFEFMDMSYEEVKEVFVNLGD